MRTIVFLCVVTMTSAATWWSDLPPTPKEFADKKGCYVEEMNEVIPFGETAYPIGHCYRIECSSSGMDYASCGVVDTNDPNCYKTEVDLTKPYPDCCPNIKCNGIE